MLDDEPQMRKALGRLLRTHGFNVVTYSLGGEMIEAFQLALPACLLLDLHMPGMTGFEVLELLKSQKCGVPVIVITGHDEPKNSERVLSLGAAAYLTKPIDEDTLLGALREAISRSSSPDHAN